MKKEDKVSEALVKSLKEKLKNNYPKIEIASQKQIFIGTTCGSYKSNLRLLFQSASQDIVVYLKDDDSQYMFEGENFFKIYRGSLTDQRILIPLVIFEIKHKDEDKKTVIRTHDVRLYSEIARAIKSNFPFCIYNFLLINFDMSEDVDRLYMAAKYFDKIIYQNGYRIRNTIHNSLFEVMWKIINQHIEFLRREEYYRLGTFL